MGTDLNDKNDPPTLPSRWRDGRLQPGHLCPFCGGRGAFFDLRAGRASWTRCMACEGAGSPDVVVPAQIRIGAKQGTYLKRYPKSEDAA